MSDGQGEDAAGPEAADPNTRQVEGGKEEGTTSSGGPLRECRICLTTDNQHDIVEPCACTGTVQYAHLECLRSWCVNNLSLKCEICGSVYKDSVVEPLMGTLIEAQDRQVAAQGLSDEQGIRLDVLDAAARQRDSAHPGGAGLPADPATVAETQQRMQAFLEELLQLYAARSEAMLERSNRDAFPPEPQFHTQPRRHAASFACGIAFLLLWLLVVVILGVLRLLTQDSVRDLFMGVGSFVLLVFAVVYFRNRCASRGGNDPPDAPFGRHAREVERQRQLREAQRAINPPIIRIVR